MSKALVIKGANFADNKVETITLSEVIPCTGISISPTTVAFDTLGATQQLTPTLTPADTTETVYYVSSNEDVVTVSDTGLITCVGLGTATITATCGDQSATCVCTVASITVNANTAYSISNGVRYSGSYEAPNKDYAGISALARARTYYSDTPPASGYHAFVTNEYDQMYAIAIPRGTNKIVFNTRSTFSDGIGYAFFDDTQHQTYVDDADMAAKCVGGVFYSDQTSYFTVSLSNYPGANSFVFCPYAPSGSDASTITGDVTVTFSVE